jgi:hypothetical protein
VNQYQPFFTSNKLTKCKKIKIKNSKMSYFGGFQSPEVRGKKKSKNHQSRIFGFHCVAKHIKG